MPTIVWFETEFLVQLIEAEVLARRDSAVARLLRQARFPDIKTFEQLDWDAPGAPPNSPKSTPLRLSEAHVDGVRHVGAVDLVVDLVGGVHHRAVGPDPARGCCCWPGSAA